MSCKPFSQMAIAELDEVIEEWKNDHKVTLDEVGGLQARRETKQMGGKKLGALLNAPCWALALSCCKTMEGKELFAVFGQDNLLAAEERMFMVQTYLGGDHEKIAEYYLRFAEEDKS